MSFVDETCLTRRGVIPLWIQRFIALSSATSPSRVSKNVLTSGSRGYDLHAKFMSQCQNPLIVCVFRQVSLREGREHLASGGSACTVETCKDSSGEVAIVAVLDTPFFNLEVSVPVVLSSDCTSDGKPRRSGVFCEVQQFLL